MKTQTMYSKEGRTENFLKGLLDLGAELYNCCNQQKMLDTILKRARSLTRAQAGSLYLVETDNIKFVSVQNEVLDDADINEHLLESTIPLSMDSLSGYVALTGKIMNIPDSYKLPQGVPFRINREFDSKTGYHVKSILTMPLHCPDGKCVGVLQLFNRKSRNGTYEPFPKKLNKAMMFLASSAAINIHNISLQKQLRQVHLNTIFKLSTLAEYRDADTNEHIKRVSKISESISRELGLGAENTELIKYASPMHDVGKVAIPDAILLKPGYLTTEQREVMQRHTIVGAEIFGQPEDEVLKMAQEVALCHHERWDGEGYPRKLKEDEIPLSGRIVAVADVFDAIVSKRCYKAACSLDVALDIIKKDSGKHFDPQVVEAFLAVLDKVLPAYTNLKEE